MAFKGKVWKYGDNVNTDVIFPGKYTYTVNDPKEMAQHALEDLDPGFIKGVAPGDIVVGGLNFGCGSSREQAAIAVKYSGIQVVLAKYFARIFYRNAINLGIIVLEYERDIPDTGSLTTTAKLDLEKNQLLINDRQVPVKPLPGFAKDIIERGGIIEWFKATQK